MKQRLPKVLSNPVSLTGLVIAVFNFGFIVFLLVVEAMSSRAHPYADLIIWLVLPALVLFGVVLIIVGVRRDRRREKQAAGDAGRRTDRAYHRAGLGKAPLEGHGSRRAQAQTVA
jgi:hypothetical protein